MIDDALMKRTAFWEKDISENHGQIYNQYVEIKTIIQNNDLDFAKARLKELELHAIKNTAFYGKYSANDIFPVVTKSDYTGNYSMFRATNGNFNGPFHITSTSGSTGTPLEVIQDYKKRCRNIADLKVFGELANYPSHERMMYFRVLSSKLHRTAEQEEAENIFYIDSSRLADEYLEDMVNQILSKKPNTIFSYASTLITIAKYIARKNIDVSKSDIKSVLTAGEGISKQDREMLQKIYNCPVYRRYSNMEMGVLGQDDGCVCQYKLNWGSYYFECVKLDSDEASQPGEVGRIVVTDLFNYAFPMIRYDTGDLGEWDEFIDGQFPCFKEIYGRSRDFVYDTNGNMISPAAISVQMWGETSIKQWQFIQEDIKKYRLLLNVNPQVDTADTNVILYKLKIILGLDADIKVVYVDEIPILSSNKRRAVVCNL